MFPVPRRSKYIKSHGILLAQLGAGAFERHERLRDRDGNATGRRHIGWRWACDCAAFARAEGDYLWVPCRRHEPANAARVSFGRA